MPKRIYRTESITKVETNEETKWNIILNVTLCFNSYFWKRSSKYSLKEKPIARITDKTIAFTRKALIGLLYFIFLIRGNFIRIYIYLKIF